MKQENAITLNEALNVEFSCIALGHEDFKVGVACRCVLIKFMQSTGLCTPVYDRSGSYENNSIRVFLYDNDKKPRATVKFYTNGFMSDIVQGPTLTYEDTISADFRNTLVINAIHKIRASVPSFQCDVNKSLIISEFTFTQCVDSIEVDTSTYPLDFEVKMILKSKGVAMMRLTFPNSGTTDGVIEYLYSFDKEKKVLSNTLVEA